MNRFLLTLLLVLQFTSVLMAEKADSCFYVQVDLANRWIWRATPYSDSPVIQPSIGYANRKLSASIWGSYAFESKAYSEIDFTFEYQLTKKFRLCLIDYFTTSDVSGSDHKFFNFNESESSHMFDLYAYHKPFKRTPVTLLYSIWIWGPDRDRITQKQNYSTYFEAKYTKTYNNFEAYTFAGMTPWKGFYASEAALVNVGVGLNKTLKLGGVFAIPAKIEFVLNPYTQKTYINAIISIK
jgi:hypothetical protein